MKATWKVLHSGVFDSIYGCTYLRFVWPGVSFKGLWLLIASVLCAVPVLLTCWTSGACSTEFLMCTSVHRKSVSSFLHITHAKDQQDGAKVLVCPLPCPESSCFERGNGENQGTRAGSIQRKYLKGNVTISRCYGGVLTACTALFHIQRPIPPFLYKLGPIYSAVNNHKIM